MPDKPPGASAGTRRREMEACPPSTSAPYRRRRRAAAPSCSTCWVDVINAGGAVGFVPPVTDDDVAPVLDRLLEGVASGRAVLRVLTVDGATAGSRRSSAR